MASWILGVIFAVLAIALAFIGATELGVCNDGLSFLYFAAAEAAGASAAALFIRSPATVATMVIAFLFFLGFGFYLFTSAGCSL